jgi:alcohol dehydrogenase class IV
MHEQWERRWDLAELKSVSLGRSYVIASKSVRSIVSKQFSWPLIDRVDALPLEAETLVVVGGGSLIDRVKIFRNTDRASLKLIAIPSIWGSGAEVSPVAVLNGTAKDIHLSDHLIPDHYVVWPELAQNAPIDLLHFACGDVWAHALEAFTSPLATRAIRSKAAELMNEIAQYPLAFDERWFDVSAAACLLQARSSVGLIHGFAHVLEPKLQSSDLAANWGHAKLCSTFLLPVLRFNLSLSPRVQCLAEEFGLDLGKVLATAKALFLPEEYASAMTEAERNWEGVARDRCSRTNCVLVRRESIEFFRRFRTGGLPA